MTTPTIPSPRTDLPPLNLVAVERVQGLSRRAATYLLVLVASHFMEHATLDRATFLLLADEAEAVMGGTGDNVWRCTVHHINTSGDCPWCDDELIALTEDEVTS